MELLILSINYVPDKTGIAVVTTEIAEWFANNGDEVSVVTALPYYPEWKINEAYRPKDKRDEKIRGVSVFRVNLFVPRKTNTLSRIAHELSFVFSTLRRAITLRKPDVIVVVSPPLFLGLVGVLLKYAWRRKLLFNIQDLVPDAAVELRMLRSRFFIRILYVIEKFIYLRCDAIAVIGQGMLKRLRKKGVPDNRLHYVPNTADPALLSSFRKDKADNLFLKANRIGDGFAVLHSGNLGVKQGTEVIIRAAKILENHPVVFYIVGDGGEKDKIVALAKELRLTNVRFLPLQPREYLADMYHAADVSLLTQVKEVVDIVVPSKLVSMMAAGCCVVASAARESEAAKIVMKADCGRVVEPENPSELAEAIRYFFENRHLIAPRRERAKAFVAQFYDRERVMAHYRSILEKISPEGR